MTREEIWLKVVLAVIESAVGTNGYALADEVLEEYDQRFGDAAKAADQCPIEPGQTLADFARTWQAKGIEFQRRAGEGWCGRCSAIGFAFDRNADEYRRAPE